MNGDGFDDVLLSAALVFHGSKAGLQPDLKWSRLSDAANAFLGRKVAAAADLNGDGFADVLITVPEWTANGRKHGKVMVEYGSPTGLRDSDGWSIRKTWLASFQQYLGLYHFRYGTVVYWGPPLAVFSSVIAVFLIVQRRLRHRLATLIAENRELTLATERTRIARDLHDSLSADVHRLIFRAEEAKKSGDAASAPAQFTEISVSAQRVVDTISELVWATDPAHDTLESFTSYLGEFISRYAADCGLRCELQFPLDAASGSCDAGVRHNLLLITKELMHNIARHAAASHVIARLAVEGTMLRLSLHDDGRGFVVPGRLRAGANEATDDRANPNGHGLRNLAARARALGATLEIQSAPDRGTLVTLVTSWKTPPH